MRAGILSDTHGVSAKVIRAVVQEFQKRSAELLIHCGDIEAQHLDPELFGGLPVFCALNAEQLEKPGFQNRPTGWTFTQPGERIVDIRHIRMYLGHRRSFDFLKGSEQSLMVFLDTLRKDHDGLRWVCSGHTHHQVFVQTQLVNFLNPGAVEMGANGYEFATIDTENSEIVFSRIEKTKPVIPTFSIGVISDSLRISKLDQGFWAKFAKEMSERGVGSIIHCGNISIDDIGRPELEKFTVWYNLRKDQADRVKSAPPNWNLIPPENPVVEINGYRFYVELDLGISLQGKSELDINNLSHDLQRQYYELDFILCGFTRNALLVELGALDCPSTNIVNPGDAVMDRNFAVICLPRCEITFGHVPLDPMF